MIRSFVWIAAALMIAGCDRQESTPSPAPQDGAPATRPAVREDPMPPGTATWRDAAKAAADRGIRYLREAQTPDGKWKYSTKAKDPDVGITALCLLAILENPRGYSERDEPFLRDGLKWLASSQKSDGSIHGGMLATYNTSIAVLALAAAKNPDYKPVVARALEYLRVVQSDEGEGYQHQDRYFGGVGYGGDERPDLSNTQFAIEAARAAGMPDDDPFLKKATVFLQRTQNSSETNDLKDADVVPGNDGGAFYSPGTSAGEAKAGFITLSDGRKIRRSYGSMSYALLKSYLFCNMDARDPRVKALVEWLSKNYRVDYNPGMEEASEKPNAKYAGLFYYYLSMARSLTSPKAHNMLRDVSGKPLPWREDLARAVVELQRPDGSWSNERNADFWEESPVVATAFAINVLNACLK